MPALTSYLTRPIAKPDVLPLVEILTARENYLLNNLSKISAISTVHQTMTDTLMTAASRAVAEDLDYVNLARTVPSLTTNIVQIVAVPFRVTNTAAQIQYFHGENEMARQTTKSIIDWSNAAEFDLLRSTLVSGASGVAPRMEGMIRGISQSVNYTLQATGTVFSASILRGLMRANYDNSNGEVATDIFVGSFLSDRMDEWTNKSNVVITGLNATQVILATDVFETGLGKVNKRVHRYIQQPADTSSRVLAIRPEKFSIAYLQKPYIQDDLAKGGDYESRAVIGKMTLAVRNRTSNWFAEGYTMV